MSVYQVEPLREVSEKLERYAALRGIAPEEVIIDALEQHLRGQAEIAFKIAAVQEAARAELAAIDERYRLDPVEVVAYLRECGLA